MEKSNYIRVRLRKVPSSQENDVTELSFRWDSSGIAEVLSYTQRDLVYEPQLRPLRYRDLDVFFNVKPHPSFFEELRELSSEIEWDIYEEAHKDWLEEWKKGFKPFPLVGGFWVVPSWCHVPGEATHPLFIDPGMAFGTGTHATTQMAAALIDRFSKKGLGSGETVLDVGTGTAILALLAKALGANRVVGIDNDPEALRVARENVAINGVEGIQIAQTQIDEMKESFDLVIANIIDGVLLKLKPFLVRAVKEGGGMILSGILEERESPFIDEFLKETNLKIQLRLEKDEWVAFLLKDSRGS